MAKEKHYLEVGSDDVPSRARPERLSGSGDSVVQAVSSPSTAPRSDAEGTKPTGIQLKPAETSIVQTDDVKFGYDHTKTFVGIDYKGDRNESEWRSVGERLGGLIWRLLLFVAIIGWFIFQALTCERFPVYIINP